MKIKKEQLKLLAMALALLLLVMVLVFVNPVMVGGTVVYVLLIMVGTGLFVGSAILLLGFKGESWEREHLIVERQLREERSQLREQKAELTRRELELVEEENGLLIRSRRFEAWNDRFKVEEAKADSRFAELKAFYGGSIPKEESRKLFRSVLEALREEDDSLVHSMFQGTWNATLALKPIKWPENKQHDLLERGVEEKIINQVVLDQVLCPISKQVMQDPVKGEDGRTYDRFCLVNIYYALPGTYPFDRRKMQVHPHDLPSDTTMHQKIQALVKACQASSVPKRLEEDVEVRSVTLSV